MNKIIKKIQDTIITCFFTSRTDYVIIFWEDGDFTKISVCEAKRLKLKGEDEIVLKITVGKLKQNK